MSIFNVSQKTLFSFNFLSRVIFLLITPLFFQYFALGFIWHSIYWGVISFAAIIWGILILATPLIGRVGCGWFCFFGSASDLSSQHSFYKVKWKSPKLWLRLWMLTTFLGSALYFHFRNKSLGLTHDFAIIPDYIQLSFDKHYQIVWVIDLSIALLFGLLAERRWACKNLCVVGSACAVGAKYSRLLPVVDTDKCTLCGDCESDCLVRVPMINEIKENKGLITNPECILCGKCVEVCKPNAVSIKFVWNREEHKSSTVDVLSSIRQRKSQNNK